MYLKKLILPLLLVVNGYIHAADSPVDLSVYADSAAYYLQQFDYRKAIEMAEQADPEGEDPAFLSVKAAAMKGLNIFPRAIRCYEKLLSGDSSNVRIIVELAECYRSAGDHRKTIGLLSYALDLNPENTCINRRLAQSHEKLDSTDKAIRFYRKAVELNPMDLLSVYRLAGLYKQNKEYEKGISVTEEYLERDSIQVRIIRMNAFLHFMNGDFSRAAMGFEKCAALGDSSYFINKYLGYSYFRTKSYDKAKEHLEKAFRKDTLNAELSYILGLSCDYSFYKKLGIEYLNKSIDLYTPDPEFISRIYQDLAKANTGYYQYEQALQAYMKALELNPLDTLLIYHIASHYDHWIKDNHMALKYYRKFMDTRSGGSLSAEKMPVMQGFQVSYYDFVERRMNEIREELFWYGDERDTTSLR